MRNSFLKITAFLGAILLMAYCTKLVEETKAHPTKLMLAQELQSHLIENGISMTIVEIREQMDDFPQQYFLQELCPPDDYENPYSFENPLGDYTTIDTYRVISRDLSGSKQYSFTQADLLAFITVLGDTVPYSPYDLVDDGIVGSYIGQADMLAFFQWYGAPPITDVDPELFEIGLNSVTGQLDFNSGSIGLFYHQEVDSVNVLGEIDEIAFYGPGVTNSYLSQTPGDEAELNECWNSFTVDLIGGGKYEMLK